ncbi:Cys/Met metabolism PLP-dependent enzyme-domain-containing protein [Mucidula mucida]|nr:Cys/Met metabolism PLP-dependent enzyme-domain-containing protein [Mucidula mucida]
MAIHEPCRCFGAGRYRYLSRSRISIRGDHPCRHPAQYQTRLDRISNQSHSSAHRYTRHRRPCALHPIKPLVLVDNTFLSPFYASPLLMGADLVLHSLTKYINGHSDVVMGALILPPHQKALTATLRFLQNAIGAVPSPYDSWLALRGAKTLALRMKAHGLNALALAEFLSTSPHVLSVTYPGLASHPRHDRAIDALSPHARTWISKLTPDKAGIPFGGMISFRIKGGEEAAEKFLTSTRLFTLAESLGGVESLAEHPARMTHGSVPEEERIKLGIEGDLIRLSVGVEEQEDLIEDVKRALDIASRL